MKQFAVFSLVALFYLGGCTSISTFQHHPTNEILTGEKSIEDYSEKSEFYLDDVLFVPTFRFFSGEYGMSPRAGIAMFSKSIASVYVGRVEIDLNGNDSFILDINRS